MIDLIVYNKSKWKISIITLISHDQSMDHNLDQSIDFWAPTKSVCPGMGMRAVFGPSLQNIFQWNQVYAINTIKLHILCKFPIKIFQNVDCIMAKKPLKIRDFQEVRVTFKLITSGRIIIFSKKLQLLHK